HPAARYGVTKSAGHEPAGFDWDEGQRAHDLTDAASVAGGLWHFEQIEQGSGTDGILAAHSSFDPLPKRVGRTLGQFSLRSVKLVQITHTPHPKTLFLSFPSSAIRHTVLPVSTYAIMVKTWLMVAAFRRCNREVCCGGRGDASGVKVAGDY